MNGSDTPVTRPEKTTPVYRLVTGKKKKRGGGGGGGGSLGAIEILNTVEKHEWTIKKKKKKNLFAQV